MSQLSVIDKVATMSSREIAELTGKRHSDILRDISEVLKQANIDERKFASVYKGGNGQDRPCFSLPRRECDLVVSGYSVKYRLAIIDRWHELEAKQPVQSQFKIPQTLSEALKLAYEQSLVIEQQQASLEQKDQYILASNEASIKAGEILVREFVKSNDIIDLGEKQFYEWMRKQGYVLKNSCEPNGALVKRGYFTWKPTQELHGGKFRHTLRITPRGQVWLASRYLLFLDRELDAA